MLRSIHDIRALAHSGTLGEWLRESYRTKTRHRVAVGVLCASRSFSASFEAGQLCTDRGFLSGCTTKALTAELIGQVVAAGGCQLDDSINDLLPARCRGPLLDGVSLRHLLNHTHGLDSSDVSSVPRTSDQYIDVSELHRRAERAGRIAAPGDLYSYGTAGSWWAAAVLEHLMGRPYAEILTRQIFAPLAIRPGHDERFAGVICPAIGGGLRLTVDDMLRTLAWQITNERAIRNIIPGVPVPLPGMGMERGAALGWLYYGGGWFGHTALLPDASLCVRVHFEHGIGIVIATDTRSAMLLLARHFADVLPEFREIPLPRGLTHWNPEQAELDACAGTYRNAARVAVISAGKPLTIELTSGAPGSPVRSKLAACADGVFTLEPHAAASARWIQLIRPTSSGYGFAWTGKELLRRCP